MESKNFKRIMNPMEIRVECYSGYRGEETPRRFWLNDKRIKIKEVIDRWLDPEYRYFKVTAKDNATYILRHDAVSLKWDLTFYQEKHT